MESLYKSEGTEQSGNSNLETAEDSNVGEQLQAERDGDGAASSSLHDDGDEAENDQMSESLGLQTAPGTCPYTLRKKITPLRSTSEVRGQALQEDWMM